MTRVFKYELKVEDVQVVKMPKGAEVLSVAVQQNKLCVWARVDPEQPLELRRFRLAGTGHPLGLAEADWPFVGTVLLMDGKLVLHVFVAELGE